MSVNNFADHPPTIGELRSNKTESARDWTPRDVLIDLLRDIDAKKMDPDAIVVLFRERVPEGEKPALPHYRAASSDAYVTQGLLTFGAEQIQKDTHR